MSETQKNTPSVAASQCRFRAKGLFARQLVLYCVCMLTAAAVWAAVVKTADPTADLSDVLTFIGAAFGGELLLLLVKRVCTKDKTETEDETWSDC